MCADRIRNLYDVLHAAYGPQEWWPADSPFEVIVGAILTQRTAWRNVERAISAMRRSDLLSTDAIERASKSVLTEAIRAAGFYTAKTATLKGFVRHLNEEHDGALDRMFDVPTDVLRSELLGLRGIGEETADAIVVYAAGKLSFVVDAYARRVLRRLGWISGAESYETLRRLFLVALPQDVSLVREYHALLVCHGKARCRSVPRCTDCPLGELCQLPRRREEERTT